MEDEGEVDPHGDELEGAEAFDESEDRGGQGHGSLSLIDECYVTAFGALNIRLQVWIVSLGTVQEADSSLVVWDLDSEIEVLCVVRW